MMSSHLIDYHKQVQLIYCRFHHRYHHHHHHQ
ncbi:unnamed protein product [Schistosoma mattheei]|uniref:Uncharacterized protein n=1 Tax=Schistosoma mattheei TaxID=31246 RepID=A0A183Q575_9TREM|nr:unnamed protein product [Schistosoma mattheei]